MTAHSDTVTAGLSHLEDAAGVTVTYTVLGASSGTSITVVASDTSAGPDRATRNFRAKVSDIFGVKPNDTITDDAGRVWSIDPDGIPRPIGGRILLSCSSPFLHPHSG